MQNQKKKGFKKNVTLQQAVWLIVAAVATAFALLNLKTVVGAVTWLFQIFSPFIIGLFLAFLIGIVVNALENRLLYKLNRFKFWCKIKRAVCVILAIVLIGLCITLLMLLIVPQLRESARTLATNMPYYLTGLQRTIEQLLQKFDISVNGLLFRLDWQSLIGYISNLVTGITPQVATFAVGITSSLFNFLMGIFFALYMLFGKEKILSAIHRTLLAYCGKKRTARINYIAEKTHAIFKNFVVGQLTESLILGIMYFITASLFKMPYALLLSVIMAIGGLIPMFGPIIATIPCVFILLMIHPANALVFLIMAIVIQQIESNFIYPFVVGDSIGLPAIWVLLSILVGGSIFGMLGMVVAVPIASVAYALLRESVNERLAPKQLVQPEASFEEPPKERKENSPTENN